jgi:hypothetical protein
VVAALTSLSLTFAPLFLFYSGKNGVSQYDPRVIICFAANFLVPLVYIRFATLCFDQVRASKNDSAGHDKPAPTKLLTSVLLWSIVTLSAIAIYLFFRS